MNNNGNESHYNDDYTEKNVSKKFSRIKIPFFKILIISIIGGILGGGIFWGGLKLYKYYDNYSITQNNSQGKIATSNIKITETNQATQAFNKVKNAVVSVIAYNTNNSNFSLNNIINNSTRNIKEISESEGSGVIYKKDGNTAFIVTNNHVIAGCNKVEVIMNNGVKLPATIVGKDSISDLAVLKINSRYVTEVASFGNSNNIQVGQTALAIGSPLGSQYATSLTEGIISAKDRTIDITNDDGMITGQQTVIQTDAAINPGNSGGPLINLAGQVIGINSMKLSSIISGNGSPTAVEGMGFAIPSNEVVNIINQLVQNGKVIRPALGISLVNLSEIPINQQQKFLKLPANISGGVVVIKVSKDSPLREADIKKGDVIVRLGNIKVSNLANLRKALYSHKLGQTITISYYDNGHYKTSHIKLTLESNSQNTTSPLGAGH